LAKINGYLCLLDIHAQGQKVLFNIFNVNKGNYYYFLLFFLLIPFSGFSQEKWSVYVSGTVTEGKKKIDGAVIYLYKNGTESGKLTTEKSGKYAFTREPNND
jgi:hypothetical protein